MSLDTDDEILQDFLVEAGEILERLNEELVELEQSPDDMDMLNGVFRSFHTIKGGASFLGLDGLVDVCHRAEDVFNVLRNGERSVDGELMDTVLQVLDVVNSMFVEVQGGELPTPAEATLLSALEALAIPAGAGPPKTPEGTTGTPVGDEVDDEFEAMLDQVGETASGADKAASVGGGDDITEEEFDALLDQLHGNGKGPAPAANTENKVVATPDNDDITEEEFDALLDQLHGTGKGPKVVDNASAETPASTPQPVEKKPEPTKPKAKPAARLPTRQKRQYGLIQAVLTKL